MAKRDLAAIFGRCCRFFDRQRMAAYGVALGCVQLALALRLALEWVAPGIVPYATLYPALLAAALLGGVGPGLAALVCAALGAGFFLLRQAGPLVPPPSTAAINLALLLATGALLIVLAAALRRAILRLLASEERLKLAIRSTGLGTWDVDGLTGLRRWSREFRSIIGLEGSSPADPKLFAALIHPDDRDSVNERYRAAHDPAGDGWYQAEFRIRRADDGTERWVAATGRVYFDAAGKL